MFRFDKIRVLTLGTEAQTVKINGLGCLVQNNSEADIYFKEKRDDGEDASADNGWRLAAGGETRFPLLVRELSLVSEAEDADVRILILED